MNKRKQHERMERNIAAITALEALLLQAEPLLENLKIGELHAEVENEHETMPEATLDTDIGHEVARYRYSLELADEAVECDDLFSFRNDVESTLIALERARLILTALINGAESFPSPGPREAARKAYAEALKPYIPKLPEKIEERPAPARRKLPAEGEH